MWYLIGAIIAALASLSCIIATAVEYIKGKIKLLSGEFFGAILFLPTKKIVANQVK